MADDFLRCTECGVETSVTASSMYESLGRTKRGTWRKRSGWLKTLADVVAGWLCSRCLDRVEADQQSDG